MNAWPLHVALAAGLLAASSARALPPPNVRPDSAWMSQSTGSQLFVVTRRPAQPRPTLPLNIFEGLRQLAPTSALIWASTESRGHYDHFPVRAWPPQLERFRVDHGWEGQPLPRIQQRLFWFTAEGWSFDVRVYFGSQHPPATLVKRVQAELDRLESPRR